MTKGRSKTGGYVLLPVAVTIALIAVVAYLGSQESSLGVNSSASEFDAAQAEYVVQAGLQHALRETMQQGCGVYSDLSNVSLGNHQYSSYLTTDLGITTSYTIFPDQDNWIRSDQPDKNNAVDQNLHVRNQGGVIERPMYRYDLGPIPANAKILSAAGWFYLDKAHPEGTVDIHLIDADWSETDATWNTMGANIDSAILATIPAQPVAGRWVSLNFTAQVQAWVNGRQNFGITLNTTHPDIHGEYASSDSANVPYLEIVVGDPPSSPAILQAVGSLQNGVERSITRNDITLYQHPLSYRQLSLGPGNGKDVVLDSFNAQNYGNYELRVSQDSTQSHHSLIQFELPPIPPAARVVSARLELYHKATTASPVDPRVYAHGLTRAWVEGTQAGGGPADGATWNSWDGSSNWSRSGGDYETGLLAGSDITLATGDWESWEITALVRGWVNGDFPNRGLLLRGSDNLDVNFASKEDPDPALRPKLSITFACACGLICALPRSSGDILMVVDDPNALAPGDAYKKELFESWGYTVSTIIQTATQINYDIALSTSDVVFISASVTFPQVGNRLIDATIGVVSQDGVYNDDLGFAAGAAWSIGSGIDIVDTSHYITAVFAPGPVGIYRAGMERMSVAGGEANGLQTLATTSGDGALVVLETDAELQGGGNAAGRRVMLPLGRENNFDWRYLNGNGRLLVQRAIEWGIGKVDGPDLDKIILSTDNEAILGGLSFNSNDLANYRLSNDLGTMFLRGDTLGLTTKIDALHLLANGNIILSTQGDTSFAGLSFSKEDLIEYDPVADSATMYLEADLHFDVKKDIEAVHILDNGNIVLATSGNASLGGLAFSSRDLVEYNPDTGSASIFFDGDATTLSAKITAVHILEDGHIVLAASRDTTLGGLSFGADQLVDYDPVTDSAVLFFDGETLFAETSEKLGSVHVGPGSGGGPGKLLLVVGDAGAPATGDVERRSMFESWDYQVEIIDDGASQAEFIEATATINLVYVSGTSADASLADKLTGLPRPVVNEMGAKLDNFGFSSATGTATTDKFVVTDPLHYITYPFGGNPVTVFTDSIAMPIPGGSLAPELLFVGETSVAVPALVSLDSGAQRWDATPAPARRVHLPFAGAEVSQLTFDGKVLMKRALEWAGGENLKIEPVAHWKLDEVGGINAVDSIGGHHGSLTSGPIWIPALIDGGLDFDGANDYVDVGSFDVNGTGLTLTGWFNAEAIGTSDGRIISKANGASAADAWWQLSTTDSGSDRYLRMRIKAGGATTTLADSTVNLVTEQWYFAVASYDSDSGILRLYVDGTEVANVAHALGGPLDTNPAVPVAIGANGTPERFFNGILDDVRVYDQALSAATISDLYEAGAPPEPTSYTEMHQPWFASVDDTWETVDLSGFGVPANAVVEVAITNSNTDNERWAGVRAQGSALQRGLLLHESEDAGVDVLVMHVQLDDNSLIQHYADRTTDVTFTLLGYWTGVDYAERFSLFDIKGKNKWVVENLSDNGLEPERVAEIVVANTNTNRERLIGLRAVGSSLPRLFDLHEAESGGVDTLTLMVETDTSSRIEVYAEADKEIDFYVVGFWSRAPGSYTELGGVSGQVVAAASWQAVDLSSFGIPADSVAQFVITNDSDAGANNMGVRATASALNRRLVLHEAESGGSDAATLHVEVDGSSQVEWYSQAGSADRFFYPVGWWALVP